MPIPGDDPVTASLRNLVTKFKAEKDECKVEIERHKAEIENLRARVRMLEDQNLRTKESHNAEVKALNDKLRTANKSLKDAYVSQSVRDESLKDEVYTLKTTQKALDEENKLIKTYVTLLQENIGYLSTKNESLETEVKVLRECVAKFRGAVALFASNFAGYFNACTSELPGTESERKVIESRRICVSCDNSLKEVKEHIETVKKEISVNAQHLNQLAVTKEMWHHRYAELCEYGEDPFGKDMFPNETANCGSASGDGSQEAGISMKDLIDQVIGMNSIFNGQLMRDFCMMHKTFTDSETIFKEIGYKFKSTMSQKDQVIQQTKIVNFVQKWIENFPRDFQSISMQALVNMFAHVLLEGNKILSDLVLKMLARPVPGVVAAVEHPISNADNAGASLQLLDINPTELAKQITLLDYGAFVRISYEELIDPKNWTSEKEGGVDPALNVRASIQRFNRMGSWIQTEILSRESVKDRALVMRYFILLEKEFLTLNNFSGLIAISLTFKTAAIARLHQTFDYLTKKLLSKKEKLMYDELCALTSESKNWMNLRKAMETAQGPCIPYLGIFLGDIQFMTDGIAEYVKGGLNFAKKRKIASVINYIISLQPKPYTFPIDGSISAWFMSVPVYDQAQAFEISKRLESPNGSVNSASNATTGSGSAANASSSSNTPSSPLSNSSAQPLNGGHGTPTLTNIDK